MHCYNILTYLWPPGSLDTPLNFYKAVLKLMSKREAIISPAFFPTLVAQANMYNVQLFIVLSYEFDFLMSKRSSHMLNFCYGKIDQSINRSILNCSEIVVKIMIESYGTSYIYSFRTWRCQK